MNLISPYLTLGFCLKTWASQLRVVHPTVRPCNHARIRVTSTFDRILYIEGCDIEASIPFPLPSSSWKIWKSHKEATLRRQESKTASSSPKLPVGLVWKLCVPIGAEKNPILKRNYRLLSTLHWLKLFWCDHFFMLQSVQLWHLKIYRWHKHPITAPVAHWCLHLQCLKDQRDPFTPFTLFIRGSSHQRHHPTSKNSGSSWGKGHQGVLKSLAQSRNGGQDLIPWCTWCICGLDSAQMSLVDTIIYIYIYITFSRGQYFLVVHASLASPHLQRKSHGFPITRSQTLRFGTPGAFAPERWRWRYSTSHISTGASRDPTKGGWKLKHFTLGRPPKQDWWWSWWSWYDTVVCDDVLLFHEPNASATGMNSCYDVFHHLPNTR